METGMVGSSRSNGTWVALLGLVLGLAGVVSYFVIVFHFGAWLPEVRNSAHPNLALVILGLFLSAVGIRRALVAERGRWRAPALATVNLTLAGWFLWVLYGMTVVPPVNGPAIGKPAPDFAVLDEHGHATNLTDFRGGPLLLVFYRGHW
jgi:hypothetical protein